MWPGFESLRRRHMWVEFVVSSLREVFLRVLRFSPLLKNQHFQIPIRSGTHGHVSTSSYELLSDPWVNKLQIRIFFLRKTDSTDMNFHLFSPPEANSQGRSNHFSYRHIVWRRLAHFQFYNCVKVIMKDFYTWFFFQLNLVQYY